MLQKLFFSLLYLRHPRWDTGITPPELIEFIQHHSPGIALDLGCGTATNVIYLAQHGWQANGVDFVPKAIASGRRKAKQAGVQVHLQVADVTKPLSYPHDFDLILDIGCLHSLPVSKRQGYFANLIRLLVKGGTYMLYSFTREDNQQPGLSSQEIDWLSKEMELTDRRNGEDTATYRQSAWFTFQRRL